jgi:hypothetical protein
MPRIPRVRTAAAAAIVVALLPDHALTGGRTDTPSTLQSPGAADRALHPTFSEDVAPLIYEHCAPCHRPEGSGPFSLLSYQDVRRRAQQIALVTSRRIMPPWKADSPFGEFLGDRRLTPAQMELIRAWVDQGSVEGDPRQLPPLPTWNGRWQLGQPDLVIEMPPYRLRAGGEDMYRNFVLPVPNESRRYIKAWQFLPGSRVVHHATLQFDATGRSRKLDADDPDAGYEGLVAPSVQAPDGFFLDWGPGHSPYVAPDGMAWPLEKNTDLVMMLHLRPSGKEESVRAALGLYFADRPPSKVPSLVRLTRQHMDIPPGDDHYVVTDSYRLDVAVDVHTIQPHAHYLAKEMKAYADLPDGRRQTLVSIPEWDFNWQGVYRYARPVALPAGTMLTMEYVYDNSADNPANPSNPPQRVRYGQRTSDEMAEVFLQVTTKNAADRAALAAGIRAKVLPEEIVGHEKMLEAEPNDAALHDDVALLYVATGNLERAAAHFAESLRIKPQSPEAHYNLGTALLMQGNRQAAAGYLRESVAVKPDYGPAHESLAAIARTERQFDEAIEHYERAAAAYAAADQFDRALGVTERAQEIAVQDSEAARRLRDRRNAYAQHRPYRE